jgi:hypothetical protein
MTFLPILVPNLLIASVAAHFAFRYFDSENRRRIALPVRVREFGRRDNR